MSNKTVPALAALLALLAVFAFGLWHQERHAPPAADALDGPGIPAPTSFGGDFTLTDQNGKPFTQADLVGKPTLMYFGFSYCPDICPMALGVVTGAAKLLRDKNIPFRMVFVSIDPGRDKPDKLKNYVALFDSEFIGLTGTDQQIAAIAKQYGVYAKKVGDGDDYVMDHSSMYYVLDAAGRPARLLKKDATPEELAVAVERIVGEVR